MNYKYKKGQIFGKRLKIPKHILRKVYSCQLDLYEYFEYELYDKIPISCIKEDDRKIVEKFGIEKCKNLDWELTYNKTFNMSLYNDFIMTIDSQTEDINLELYKLVKDKLAPSKYSTKMKEIYSDRLFEIPNIEDDDMEEYDLTLEERYNIRNLKIDFNDGKLGLLQLMNRWELFKDKDLSYCLLKDSRNNKNITDNELKQFMTNYKSFYDVISFLSIGNVDIYSLVGEISTLKNEDERKEYLKKITDNILDNTYNKDSFNEPIELSNWQYNELFKYSSIEEYLIQFSHKYFNQKTIEEFRNLPDNYILDMSLDFSKLLNPDVLRFINEYGLKNIVDFDNECGQFFSKDNCKELLKLTNYNYLQCYGGPIDSAQSLYICDENGDRIDRPYTKDEFYEVMRRIIVNRPSNKIFGVNLPDFMNITGEFRDKNPEIFISEDAPKELQELFYAKEITPKVLVEKPEYIEYLNGKNLNSCLKKIGIEVIDNNKSSWEYMNMYELLNSKMKSEDIMDFITEYSDILDIVFDSDLENKYEIIFSMDDNSSQIKQRINEKFRRLIIEEGIAYPQIIPQSIKDNYPSMFLSSDAPKELQEAFYNRKLNNEIFDNPNYRKYLEKIDLDVLFKYMPVKTSKIIVEKNCLHIDNQRINFVDIIREKFSKDDTLNIMFLYGKYIEDVFDINKLENFNLKEDFSNEDLLNEMDTSILQCITEKGMKYDENMPMHFKLKNPTLFLNSDVSKDIKEKFYNKEFTINDFISNPELVEIFDKTNIACGLSEEYSWIISALNGNDNIKEANHDRLQIASVFSKIQDAKLQEAFKDYIVEFGENIDIGKIEYVSEVLLKLSLSNSREMYTFRKELATQILNTPNPIESLNKVEDIFIRNTIPTFGKIYSCFELLHPNFKGFNFETSKISPVLQNSSNIKRKVIVFSDLIKASFGSNNRTVSAFLENIASGNSLYEKIKQGELQYENLDDAQKKDLDGFSKILSTVYNNTMQNRNKSQLFENTEDTISDISELSKLLSPDGNLEYNLR